MFGIVALASSYYASEMTYNVSSGALHSTHSLLPLVTAGCCKLFFKRHRNYCKHLSLFSELFSLIMLKVVSP